MKIMKKVLLLTAVTLLVGSAAVAQQTAADSYDFLQAKLAAAEGKFDQALKLLDKVIAKDPSNPVLLFERASTLIDAGRSDQAETELRKVVAEKPDFYDAQRFLGRMLLDHAGINRAKADEALEHLRAAFKLNPDDLSTGMAVSQIYIATERPAEAEKILAQMLERAPDQRAINYNYAQVLTKLGRGDESKQYLEHAILLDPTFTPAVMQLIDIYQKENQWDKAAALLQPMISDDPTNVDLQKQQAFYYLRGGMTDKALAAFKAISAADPKDTRSQFYTAEALSDLERYDEADKIYRHLLEQTPNDPELLASFGLSQNAQHKYDEAAKLFRQLLAIPQLPDNLQTLANTQLAYIAMQKGNYDEAILIAKPILIFHDKPNSQALNIALEALKKQKKYNEAVALIQPIVEQYASDPVANARYVEMLIRAGDKEKAQQAALTGAKFGTRNTVSIAEAFIQAGDPKGAIDLVQEALKSKPDEPDLQFALGSAYERSGDKKAAERVFLQLLDKHPDNAATLNYLGYMWAEAGVNLDRAADMLNKAVSSEPRNGAYIDSLGWVYFQQGKLDLAEKYLSDATRLLPRDATVHQHLADVLAKRGDYVRALSLYRNALTMDPEPQDEAKIRAKIADAEKRTQTAAQRR